LTKKISFDFRLRPGWKGFLATDGSGPVLLMLLGQEEATVSGGSFVKEEYKLVVVVEAAAAMRQSGWMWHDTKPIKTSVLAKKKLNKI
jgi:hypothetical protein